VPTAIAADLTTACRPSAVRLAVPSPIARGLSSRGDFGAQPGSAARWAIEREPAVERFDAAGQAAQAGPLVVGAADAVVVDRDGEPVCVERDVHVGLVETEDDNRRVLAVLALLGR
jgi:hypothetical protein